MNVIVSPALDASGRFGSNWMFSRLHLGAAAAAAVVSAVAPAWSRSTAAAATVVVVIPAAGHETEGEAGEDQRKELGHGANSRCSSSAFWAWRRFSAWSQAAERSP